MAEEQKVFEAIASGDVERLGRLIGDDRGLAASRDDSGVSALMTAAYHRKSEMVELIRAALPELDIFESVSLGDRSRVQQLVSNPEQVATRSGDGFTPLHLAAFFDQRDIVSVLITHGADVNAVAENASRVQPLHSATASRAVEVVRTLLENGADPNAIQRGGWTALHSAAKHGDQQLVEVLLQHGADPNQRADDGESSITMARDDQVRARLSESRA